MKPILKLLLPMLLILAALLIVSKWSGKKSLPTALAISQPVEQAYPPPPVPKLLPARQYTPENPANSWERLLAADGSPIEDRAALEDIVINYLQGAPHNTRLPLGTNEEITRALMDGDVLGESAIPASHPSIVSGQLVDRWGSPWFFHQLAADLIEVRSAGPDRKLFTTDDGVK